MTDFWGQVVLRYVQAPEIGHRPVSAHRVGFELMVLEDHAVAVPTRRVSPAIVELQDLVDFARSRQQLLAPTVDRIVVDIDDAYLDAPDWTTLIDEWAELGASGIGGCCRIQPGHIAEVYPLKIVPSPAGRDLPAFMIWHYSTIWPRVTGVNIP